MMNAMDGSEDDKIVFKDGKDNFDMTQVLPLEKWCKSPQPQREEFSDVEEDSDSEDPEELPKKLFPDVDSQIDSLIMKSQKQTSIRIPKKGVKRRNESSKKVKKRPLLIKPR